MARRGQAGRREGASQSRTSLKGRYRGWLQHHRLSAADSLVKVLDNPVSSLLTWLVIGVALALPVGLSVALDNASDISGSLDSSARISLFLADGVGDADAAALAERIGAREDVVEATFMPREAALAEFSALSGFADVLDSLDDNPLPHVVLVDPPAGAEASAVSALRDELEGLPEVTQAVLDMAWLQRLNNLMGLSRRLVLVLGGLLLVGVVLILGNTIRLAIENRREEIVVTKLVGGSNAFVRRPFLYTGLWFGVGGGVVAALLVAAALWLIHDPVAALAASYGSSFELAGLGLMGSLNLVLFGGALGLAGAWLAVSRHLSGIEPR
jgi:cell division transport system permease protein